MARNQVSKFDAKYRGRKNLNVSHVSSTHFHLTNSLPYSRLQRLLLVGGGSNNGYVKQRFKNMFEHRSGSPVPYVIRVLVPDVGA